MDAHDGRGAEPLRPRRRHILPVAPLEDRKPHARPDEEGIAGAVLEQVETSANIVYRAPTSDLLELAAAFASCRAVVSNDTGPLHLSAAVGTPTCGIYRRGLPHFLLPEPHRTIVAPERDISRVSVADVAAAASELLH